MCTPCFGLYASSNVVESLIYSLVAASQSFVPLNLHLREAQRSNRQGCLCVCSLSDKRDRAAGWYTYKWNAFQRLVFFRYCKIHGTPTAKPDVPSVSYCRRWWYKFISLLSLLVLLDLKFVWKIPNFILKGYNTFIWTRNLWCVVTDF